MPKSRKRVHKKRPRGIVSVDRDNIFSTSDMARDMPDLGKEAIDRIVDEMVADGHVDVLRTPGQPDRYRMNERGARHFKAVQEAEEALDSLNARGLGDDQLRPMLDAEGKPCLVPTSVLEKMLANGERLTPMTKAQVEEFTRGESVSNWRMCVGYTPDGESPQIMESANWQVPLTRLDLSESYDESLSEVYQLLRQEREHRDIDVEVEDMLIALERDGHLTVEDDGKIKLIGTAEELAEYGIPKEALENLIIEGMGSKTEEPVEDLRRAFVLANERGRP